ncbi:MAG TPA: hypothetical protein VMX17_03425 [Candidatus Glassbacteria bacterium]|nr:hypothetical protein [Candidatus Glassbacteria bacterium]
MSEDKPKEKPPEWFKTNEGKYIPLYDVPVPKPEPEKIHRILK